MLDPATTVFRELFGMPPEIQAKAPGRVNLIGDHTDYQQGFALPSVLPLRTVIHLRPTTDGRVRAASLTVSGGLREYALGAEQPAGEWLDYVKAITWVLRGHGFALTGADVLIDSTLPPGAGVASSAALQVALLRAFTAQLSAPPDDLAIARLAHAAETGFVGAGVGVMDQMVCSVGLPGAALFLDTRSLEYESIPLPDTADLAVVDSGIAHQHAGGDYATRRRESFAAAAALGLDYLRDAGPADLDRLERLPPVLCRRARHVVTENQRVLAAVEALRRGDAAQFGALLNASHRSLRDDYETSLPEIDVLVALAQADPDVYGARLTGGGFGGAVVMVTRPGRAGSVAARLVERYQSRVDRPGRVLVPAPPGRAAAAGGAR